MVFLSSFPQSSPLVSWLQVCWHCTVRGFAIRSDPLRPAPPPGDCAQPAAPLHSWQPPGAPSQPPHLLGRVAPQPKSLGKNPRCHEKLSQSLLLLPESMVQQLYCSILLNRFGIVHLHLNSILNSSVSFCKACWSWMLGRERKFSWLRPDSKKVRRSQLNSLKRGFKKAWRRLEGWRNVANLGQPWTSMETIVQNPIEELVLSGISGYVRHVFVVWLSPSWYSSDDEFL